MKESEFITVGWAYGQAEAALAMALLGASGIRGFPHTWHTAAVQWSLTHALGGIELRVPAAQAADAMALLAESPMTSRPRRGLRRLLAAAVMVAAFLLVGAPPPPNGFFASAFRSTATPASSPNL